jgi:hypothetical protein
MIIVFMKTKFSWEKVRIAAGLAQPKVSGKLAACRTNLWKPERLVVLNQTSSNRQRNPLAAAEQVEIWGKQLRGSAVRRRAVHYTLLTGLYSQPGLPLTQALAYSLPAQSKTIPDQNQI